MSGPLDSTALRVRRILLDGARRAYVFTDGNQNVPGCVCENDCEFPCWQRVGVGPPCEVCGCPPGLFDEDAA